MELRRAEDHDWERIWPIWHEVVAAGETYPWARDTPKEQARKLWMLPSPAEVWVATSGPEILGTALLKPSPISDRTAQRRVWPGHSSR